MLILTCIPKDIMKLGEAFIEEWKAGQFRYSRITRHKFVFFRMSYVWEEYRKVIEECFLVG